VERSSGTIRNTVPVKPGAAARRPRADAQRNREALLDAAKAVFVSSGVDAPPKRIAEAAGVGVGTLYRHFPTRSELIAAVFEREINACADAAVAIAAEHPPGAALEQWLLRLTQFVATKRGLATALGSPDPAFSDLIEHFKVRFVAVLEVLLEAARAAGDVRATISAEELLYAVATLCHTPVGDQSLEQSRRLVSILVNGLRI
jgi:AcrR family transcriptional regulator